MTTTPKSRSIQAFHFYGMRGDPGPTGYGVAGEMPPTSQPEKALAWAIDRIERPIIGDKHPGRVLVRLREGRGHGVSYDIWVRPSTASPGHAVMDIHPPEIWWLS